MLEYFRLHIKKRSNFPLTFALALAFDLDLLRLISFEIYRGGGSMCQGWHIERWSGMDACLRGPLER